MENALTILFSLLCLSTVIPTQSTDSESKYDITKLLNSSITRIFESVDSYTAKKLIYSIENRNAINFETEIAYDAKPFNNTFYFTRVNISVLFSRYPQIDYDFTEDKMIIFNADFSIKLEGYVGPIKSEAYAGFVRSLDFKNLSIITTKSSDNLPNVKFQIEISYDDVEFNYMYLPWFREDLPLYQQKELGDKIKYTLPSVFAHTMNINENFLKALNKTFCKQTSKKEIALTHPDFLKQEQNYYYRAQNVSSFHITLGDIIISGLSNFHSFKFENTFDNQKYTLLIENIRGNASLCYGTENVTVFELGFQIQSVSLMVNKELQNVYVEAQNYSILETQLNISLTESQSKWVMEGIGRAIAASMMPSMRICKNKEDLLSETHERIHPTIQLFGEISEKFRQASINDTPNNWTPFDGNYTATKLAFYPESHNYSISVHNLTIYPEIQNQYPYQIECHFFKMLQIIYNVDGNATGKVRLRNTTDEIVDIDFYAQFTFADQIIKRSQKANYEFKMWLVYYRQPVTVQLLPTEYTYGDDEKSEIIKQINETLLSMTRQIMLNNAELLLTEPLDFCTQPDKPIDDFMPPFDDYQAPYVIPGGAVHGGNHFTAKIYNITLHGLSNFDLARVAFNKKDVSNTVYDSTDESVGSYVEFPIRDISGRMCFNDSSVKFEELQLVGLNELLVVNATSEGKINVFPGFKYKLIPVPDDSGFSCYDSMWIMEKLEDIIESSLSKKKDDLLYSILL